MEQTPNNKISLKNTELIGSGVGLVTSAASEEICSDALFYLSEGHVWLDCVDGNWALVGDKSEDAKSVATYYKLHVADPSLSELTPAERLAKIVNQLALELDHVAPTPQGVPTRMQALWLIQNDREIGL